MSGLLSAIHDANRRTDVTTLRDAVDEFLSATPAEKMEAVLSYDEPNGLVPTQASMHVLYAVLTGFQMVEKRWAEEDLPGAPSVTDYAAGASVAIHRRYAE